MTVEVVISWRPGDPQRERNLRWVLARWSEAGWPVTLSGEHNTGPWCRAADVTPAIEASGADVIVCADADCWSDGIYEAVSAVEQGAAWAVPHQKMFRLTEQATEQVLAGEPPEDQTEFAERPYQGLEAGTLFVIRRDVYLDVPLDPRFIGWGQEDQALSLALRCLHEPPWRKTKAPCWHLWHPPQSRRSRGIGNDHNLALYRRYKASRHNPARMRAIVNEIVEVSA